MAAETLLFLYLIIAIIGLTVFFFIIRYAVSEGIKKHNRVIISLLYKIAERKGVPDYELSEINDKIKELD